MFSIKRLRWLFAVVALLVYPPLLLMIGRAQTSARAEQQLEQRLVADRLIDEMERELSAFLRREEDRPFGDYRAFSVPDDPTLGNVPRPSPLREPLPEPFVVGPFQVAPFGSLSTPLGAADAVSHQEAAQLLLDSLKGLFLSTGRLEKPADVKSERAGKTVRLQGEAPATPASSNLEVISKLNRSSDERLERKSKLTQTQSANVAVAPLQQNLASDQGSPVVALRLEPMVGRRIDSSRMMLYRTVQVGPSSYRQGLVLEIETLVEWLGQRVLGAGIRDVRVLPAGAASPGLDFDIFKHQFAEPFGPIEALVVVPPPRDGVLRSATWLGALLLAAVSLGLAALYAMVAVALRYAERRNDFVSAVTHELKTPLTAIRLYGEMLRDGMVADEKKRRRYYETIISEGERLSRLVENVLELARLERREPVLVAVRGDVAAALREAVSIFALQAQKDGFELVLELEPHLPPARFERDALIQILFNLIDNALKYSRDAETKRVEVSARLLPEDQGKVAICVADHGPGVAPKLLRQIFEPFWRGGSELTRRTKGTGIGLALVCSLVERMGGSVVARNRAGKGLEVEVVLDQ